MVSPHFCVVREERILMVLSGHHNISSHSLTLPSLARIFRHKIIPDNTWITGHIYVNVAVRKDGNW